MTSENCFPCKTLYLKENLNSGFPTADVFEFRDSVVDISNIPENSIAVQLKVISADPYLRGQIKSTGSIKAGCPMFGFVGGKVFASKNSSWVVGDLFGGRLPFATFQVVTADALASTVTWKLTNLINENEISLSIGVLGMPGATAYGGVVDVLRPNPGETIFVSAAAGAVGSLAGMIAKEVYNCRVIGSCGGPDKCELVKQEFKFDAAIDYKTTHTTAELVAAIKAVSPTGIDMYFENVGGIHFEAAMATLRTHGRVAVCGQISEYNSEVMAQCPVNIWGMIYTQQRIEGFLSTTWLTTKQASFLQDMHKWLREGKLKAEETFFDGFEQWPTAFQSLFTGSNRGKVVVRV